MYKDVDSGENSTEDSGEDKKYNDANYWGTKPEPNEEIMDAIMKDLDL